MTKETGITDACFNKVTTRWHRSLWPTIREQSLKIFGQQTKTEVEYDRFNLLLLEFKFWQVSIILLGVLLQ